ncbi:MAG: hypothetical protein AAGA08_15685 [Pseudomonadota bacterium]
MEGKHMCNKTDPHAAWLNEWRSEMECLEPVEEDSPEEAMHSNHRHELGALLANTPATTPAGLVAKLEWFKEDLGDLVTTMVGDDLNSCINTLLNSARKQVKPMPAPAHAE